jgi:hypothetical protein
MKEQGALNHSRDLRLLQVTTTMTLIEISLNSTAHDGFDLSGVLVLQILLPSKKHRCG